MIEVDGAWGEGGGQLLRIAVAMAAVTGKAIRVSHIRARRRNPGLAPQHVAAVRAVASVCDAQCEGVEPRSTTITFAPRRLRGGDFRVDVGTAGSITLVLQALLPAFVASHERCCATLRGGTDVRAAPPVDYLRRVLLPLVGKMGVRAELTVLRRGYYPKGGGEVRLELAPTPLLQPFVVEDPGRLEGIRIHAHVAQLAREIAERMESAARLALPPELAVRSEIEVCEPACSDGPGGAIVLRALSAHTTLGAAQIAERGVRAEVLGQRAAEMLRRDLRAGATLDLHASDQMLIFLALADGPSAFRASGITLHARTAMWLLEQLAGTGFVVTPLGAGFRVQVTNRADHH
ncbi:MAG TPA: RNA 3'-terminal phosphate cyclase [Burkholderiaceae bacterium]|nr:RNA 3'-terminal phosphate cyclase [Burkholderiaceae bacterium]